MLTPIDRPILVAVLATGMTRISVIFLIICIILYVDVYARWKDYTRIRNKPFTIRQAYKYRVSWCSRGVATYVWGRSARKYYRQLGYKPWHIFPDGAPMCFFQIKFWKGMVGI